MKRPELLVGVVDATVIDDFGRIWVNYLLICFYFGASFFTLALKKEDWVLDVILAGSDERPCFVLYYLSA